MDSNDGPFGKAPNINVGVSDAFLLFVSSIGFIMLAGTMYSIILTRLKSAKEIEQMEQDLDYNQQLANADVTTLNRAQRRARARHIMKQQRRIAPAPTVAAPGNPAAAAEMEADENDDDNDNRNNNNALLAIRGGQDDDEEEDDDNEEDDDDGQDQSLHRHLSRKERQKAAKAAEKEERRLFEGDRQKQQRAAQETAQREKKLREQRQAEHAEDQRRLRLEQKKVQEQTEFEKWNVFLASVDGTRTVLVADWISQLEKVRGVKNRTVQLSSLAKEYGLPVTTVQQRIQELVDVGRVNGIFEADRQMFIYVTQGELWDMAKIIQGKDQVTLQYISMLATELMDQD
jgi:DDRGK domain